MSCLPSDLLQGLHLHGGVCLHTFGPTVLSWQKTEEALADPLIPGRT